MRLIGLGLAIVPLFLGFLPVLVDARRRGLHDFLAGTVVLYAEHELAAHAPARGGARPEPGARLRPPGLTVPPHAALDPLEATV